MTERQRQEARGKRQRQRQRQKQMQRTNNKQKKQKKQQQLHPSKKTLTGWDLEFKAAMNRINEPNPCEVRNRIEAMNRTNEHLHQTLAQATRKL